VEWLFLLGIFSPPVVLRIDVPRKGWLLVGYCQVAFCSQMEARGAANMQVPFPVTMRESSFSPGE